MIINPIIPIWLMAIICAVLLLLKRKGATNYMRQILVVILLFIINIRIMVPNGEMPTTMATANVLFVIDDTISMLAEDGEDGARRIDMVKEDCTYIMEKLPGASFSVVTFADSVKRLLPYTIDTVNANQAISTLSGQTTLYAQGTSLNDVLDEMEDILDDGSENYQIVFFISDGEITKKEKIESYPELSDYVDDGAVLGYGTKKGGKMYAPAYRGDDEIEEMYYYDENYDRQPALSKIDEKNLKSVADDFDVEYIHMSETSDIDEALEEIASGIKVSANEANMDKTEGYADTYYWLLVPLLVMLIWDYVYYKRGTLW